MPSIQIRNLNQEIYEKLKQRAKKDRRSIQQEAVWIIETSLNHLEKGRSDSWETADLIQKEMREIYGELSDSTPDIREMRNAR